MWAVYTRKAGVMPLGEPILIGSIVSTPLSFSLHQDRNQGGRRGENPPKIFSTPLERRVGHSLKLLNICSLKDSGSSQKTFRPSWCPKLVTGQVYTLFKCITLMLSKQLQVRFPKRFGPRTSFVICFFSEPNLTSHQFSRSTGAERQYTE